MDLGPTAPTPTLITTAIPNLERQVRTGLMGYMFLMSLGGQGWGCTEKASDDVTVHNILLILSEMKRQGTYAVVDDKELMLLASSRVAQMRDADWKRMATCSKARGVEMCEEFP